MDFTTGSLAVAHDLYARSASAAPQDTSRPSVYKTVGIILAISSGLFIGCSFVLKKIGLLKANKKYNEEAGEGYGYLKNFWWWTGMTLMIIGEICNFVAYAFVDAILVTPLGALSVVVTTILSAIFLKERLSFVGKVGCFNCIIGSIVIVVNAPVQSSVATIQDMKKFVLAPGFLVYASIIILGSAFIALWVGPRYGKKSMLVYLSICSLVGGLSVVATQGLGAAIISQIHRSKSKAIPPQLNQWFFYVLLVFVIATLVTEIIFLNKALNLFNAALVTPTYYVFFTSSTIVASAILFQGFKGTPASISTVVMGFFQICSGVVLLQLSKSAKNLPDAAVFKGDLDQVRTVAEQQESEFEPHADAVRGSALILRSISTSRQKREAQEVKRFQEERMEPIGEHEQVEWDGIRRRKTIITPGGPDTQRRRTLHPPLGMSQFPSEDPYTTDEERQPGLSPRRRSQTYSTWIAGRMSSLSGHSPLGTRPTSTVPLEGLAASGNRLDLKKSFTEPPPSPALPSHHQLQQLQQQHHQQQRPQQHHHHQQQPQQQGVPSALRFDLSHTPTQDTTDTSYHSPRSASFGKSLAQGTDGSHDKARNLPFLTPPTPSPTGAKRQFSFHNVFNRRKSQEDRDSRPLSRGGLSFMSNRSGRGPQGTGHPSGTPTEEERLGLVKGDSSNALVPSHGRGGSDGSSGSEAGERAYALQKAETESLPSYDGDVDDKGSDEEDGGSSSHKAGAASSHAAPKARSNHKRQGTLVSPEDAAHLPRSPYDTRDEGILQHREPRRRNGNDDDDEAFTLHKGERAFV